MSTILCVSPRCWPTEADTPRLAADGLRLCPQCTRAIGADAIEAGVLYGELALRLAASDAPGEGKPANKPGSREPNEAAVAARAEIAHTLAAWVRLISDERGMHLPRRTAVQRLPDGVAGPARLVWQLVEEPSALAAYIAQHAEWLAAHPLAADASAEMGELARGRARAVAYPSGGRRWQVRGGDGQPVPCPGTECGGTLWALLRSSTSLLPSELACDADDDHRLPATHWLEYGKRIKEAA